MQSEAIRAPSWALLVTEPGRAFVEYGLLAPALPLLMAAPAGDGHPVMVLPGMAASDVSTLTLRAFLSAKGYAAYGWEQGRNTGSSAIAEPLRRRLETLRRRHGTTVSLVGWSLGGVYARELAKTAPADVRCDITLGSPFRGPWSASNAWRAYEFLSGRKAREGHPARFEQPPPVPTTAVYTRTDGIVAWQRCREDAGDRTESVEVVGSHVGLGHNACALVVIADRLAQPEGAWRPFAPRGALRFLFPPSRAA